MRCTFTRPGCDRSSCDARLRGRSLAFLVSPLSSVRRAECRRWPCLGPSHGSLLRATCVACLLSTPSASGCERNRSKAVALLRSIRFTPRYGRRPPYMRATRRAPDGQSVCRVRSDDRVSVNSLIPVHRGPCGVRRTPHQTFVLVRRPFGLCGGPGAWRPVRVRGTLIPPVSREGTSSVSRLIDEYQSSAPLQP